MDAHRNKVPGSDTIKYVVGLALFIAGTVQLFKAHAGADPFGILFGAGLLIVASGFLAPLIAAVIAKPAGRLFYPGEKLERPPSAYSIPRSRRAFGKNEEGIQELQAIAKEYPDAVEAWSEMLDVAVVDLMDGDRASVILHQGMATLPSPEAREELGRTFKAMMIRLKEHRAVLARDSQPFRLKLPPDELPDKTGH